MKVEKKKQKKKSMKEKKTQASTNIWRGCTGRVGIKQECEGKQQGLHKLAIQMKRAELKPNL